MDLNFRFAIVSDLHIALPHTLWDHPSRFHLVEVSIPALELVLQDLQQLDLDFLLIPGDLTQHGEPDNHLWLAQRLLDLPFPVYVIPGNHDVPVILADNQSISWADFPRYYPQQGYHNCQQLYYTCEILPQVRLIALNSNQFNAAGKQIGYLDEAQIDWLDRVLASNKHELVLVMIHHNVVEHFPDQSNHILGKRYMLGNAPRFLEILGKYDVQLVFTGHLHVQNIAKQSGIYDITTGSLVSYPHPYRVCNFLTNELGEQYLDIKSYCVNSLDDWPNLASKSREWIADRSLPFMLRLLTEAPLHLHPEKAAELAPQLRYFWADIAQGDIVFDFPDFSPEIRRYFAGFSGNVSNNNTVLKLE